MTVKALQAFMVIGYSEDEALKVVQTGRDEPFSTAQQAQHWIDTNEPVESDERWFVVQSLNTDRV